MTDATCRKCSSVFFALLIAGVAAVPAAAADPDIQFTLGPEVNVGACLTTTPLNQYQSDLRTDPLNANRMVITAKNGSEEHTVAFYSGDGGTTWSSTRQNNSGDPDVVYDMLGNAYWTFIDKDGTRHNSVRRSFDGGATWQPSQTIVGSAWVDHPHVTVDRSAASPYSGSVYFAGRVSGASKVTLARSGDQGANWQTTTVTLPSNIGQGFVHQMTVLRNGTLIVPVQSQSRILVEDGRYAGSERELYVMRSTDGGQTFGSPIYLADKDVPSNPGPSGFRSNAGVASGMVDGVERLYYVFPQPMQSAPGVLKLMTSDDGGLVWTSPRTVAPPTPSLWGAGAPSVMVNRDGVLGISYFNQRDDLFDLYFVASADGGQTFSDPLRISTVSSIDDYDQPREPGADQVYSDVAADGTFKLVWTDNRDGDNLYTIYHRSVSVQVPEPATAGLLTLGALLAVLRRRCR